MPTLAKQLTILLNNDASAEEIRDLCEQIIDSGIECDIIEDDNDPESYDDTTARWVRSDRTLVVDGVEVASWTRCGMGYHNFDGVWTVENDNNDGGDIAPALVAVAIDALGLYDDVPSVPDSSSY